MSSTCRGSNSWAGRRRGGRAKAECRSFRLCATSSSASFRTALSGATSDTCRNRGSSPLPISPSQRRLNPVRTALTDYVGRMLDRRASGTWSRRGRLPAARGGLAYALRIGDRQLHAHFYFTAGSEPRRRGACATGFRALRLAARHLAPSRVGLTAGRFSDRLRSIAVRDRVRG